MLRIFIVEFGFGVKVIKNIFLVIVLVRIKRYYIVNNLEYDKLMYIRNKDINKQYDFYSGWQRDDF